MGTIDLNTKNWGNGCWLYIFLSFRIFDEKWLYAGVLVVTNGKDGVLGCWSPPLEPKFTTGGPGIVNDTESAHISGKTTPLYSVCMETRSS